MFYDLPMPRQDLSRCHAHVVYVFSPSRIELYSNKEHGYTWHHHHHQMNHVRIFAHINMSIGLHPLGLQLSFDRECVVGCKVFGSLGDDNRPHQWLSGERVKEGAIINLFLDPLTQLLSYALLQFANVVGSIFV